MKSLFVVFSLGSLALRAAAGDPPIASLTTPLPPSATDPEEKSDSKIRIKFSGQLDLEAYALPRTPPGLLYTRDGALFNPRLSLFVDGQAGRPWYFFLQARIDRGFDPSDEDAQFRLDEYALRWTPWDDGRLNIQIGQFATVTGNWNERHLSWDNPFINAPVPYENVTGIWDFWPVDKPETLIGWGHVPTPGHSSFGDGYYDKNERLPVVWGPSYATGVSVAGKLGKLEYAAEMKNAGLSSRPDSWDTRDVNFDHPTWSGRLGYRPNMAWNLGISASAGPYLRPEAGPYLPPGTDIGDYQQYVLAHDISFQWHHFQLWSEIYWSRFEVPNTGDADTLAWYVEAKYKFTPQFYGALRWNQQFFGDVTSGGKDVPWGRDLWRLDTALGYRFTPHTQLKLQYGLQHERYNEEEIEHLLAAQFTCKF